MNIKIQKNLNQDNGVLIIPIFQDQKKLSAKLPREIMEFIDFLEKNKKFGRKTGEIIQNFIMRKNIPHQVIVLGLGKNKNYNAKKARRIGGKLGNHIKNFKTAEIDILLDTKPFIQEFVEGILMSTYRIEKYKSARPLKDQKTDKKINTIHLISEQKGLNSLCEKATTISEAIHFVRDLVNGPANIIDEDYLVKTAKKIAKDFSYKITVLGNKELKKMKWGGILAVNQGARAQARCVTLEYYGAKDKKEKPVVIIGKGMIFDCGGYNIKHTNNIETMHQDMAGAATVMGLFSVLRKLGVKKNVIGITPIAENMINEHAYRPSDIITMYNGITVEITNTDAEGRLILADAITHGLKYRPQSIITIATLTGAVSVALGNRYAGLIANNKKLRQQVEEAGRNVDDLGWPLPLHQDYKKKMDSQVADIRNSDTGTSKYAGSSKGGAFLERFVEKNPWCHIDIGGTAFTEDPKSYETKGATAHGLRMLLEFLQS